MIDGGEDKVRQIFVYGDQFWGFYNKQTQKVKARINWTIGLIAGTDHYEIRVTSGTNIYY